jgi:manganese transport protein
VGSLSEDNALRRATVVTSSAVAQSPSELHVLRGRGRLRMSVALVGPAFVAAMAYVDPGNFATNVTAGADYGYALVWVVVAANLIAMVVQYLSAKVGVATGRDLAELCRQTYHPAVTRGMWVQAEVVAMATDLAEFVGAALGLNLLFGIPMFPAGLITAVVAYGLLALQHRGYRRYELAIAGLLGIVCLGFSYNLARVHVDWPGAATGLVPSFPDGDAVVLAGGIIGATVMPHVVYLHSALTKGRVGCADGAERQELMRFQRADVLMALGTAGLINLSMVLVAAAVFHGGGGLTEDSIGAAHAGLAAKVGGGAALAFAIALLASGLGSASVGTYAGQVVMQGFIRRRISLFLRRGLTMLPALVVLGLGLPPTQSLVFSQVVLSFGIPFALVPLVLLTRRADLMGVLVNRTSTTVVASVVAALIVGLNGYIIVSVFG